MLEILYAGCLGFSAQFTLKMCVAAPISEKFT